MIRPAAVAISAVALLAQACSSREPGNAAPTKTSVPPRDSLAKDAADADLMNHLDAGARTTPMSCEDARRAIEARQFVGWDGLPASCTPLEMFGIPPETELGYRMLGAAEARQRGLEIPGYYNPRVSVRDGSVVLFDGTNPDLAGGWTALAADLGEPEAKEDFAYSSITIPKGEWIYPARGITVFVRTDTTVVLHIAVYTPTTLSEYKARLQPHLGPKKPLPR